MSYQSRLIAMGIGPPNYCTPDDSEFEYLTEEDRRRITFRHLYPGQRETYINGDLYIIYAGHVKRCDTCRKSLELEVEDLLSTPPPEAMEISEDTWAVLGSMSEAAQRLYANLLRYPDLEWTTGTIGRSYPSGAYMELVDVNLVRTERVERGGGPLDIVRVL